VKDGIMKYPAMRISVEAALVHEHGYLYIASIADGRTRKERGVVAVKDCST